MSRYCDRCGVKLTEENNTCGYDICDKCNEELEKECANNDKARILEKAKRQSLSEL